MRCVAVRLFASVQVSLSQCEKLFAEPLRRSGRMMFPGSTKSTNHPVIAMSKAAFGAAMASKKLPGGVITLTFVSPIEFKFDLIVFACAQRTFPEHQMMIGGFPAALAATRS